MSSKRKFSETDFCDDSDSYTYGGDRKKKRGESQDWERVEKLVEVPSCSKE